MLQRACKHTRKNTELPDEDHPGSTALDSHHRTEKQAGLDIPRELEGVLKNHDATQDHDWGCTIGTEKFFQANEDIRSQDTAITRGPKTCLYVKLIQSMDAGQSPLQAPKSGTDFHLKSEDSKAKHSSWL